MNIVIIGAGALGSHLVLFGRNWDARLTVVDFDRVERKNVMSQFHTNMGTGRNKTVALQQAMQGLFGLRLVTVPHALTGDNARELLAPAGLVVDCVDNRDARLVIQAAVRAAEVPCLHGALAADGAYARVMWDECFEVDEGGEGEATCENGEHLPFIGVVASQMAAVVQRFLEDGRRDSLHIHPTGLACV
jgi:molybdopterin-synthase adenylyltransferase